MTSRIRRISFLDAERDKGTVVLCGENVQLCLGRGFGEEVSDVWTWWVGGRDSYSVDKVEKDDGVNRTEDMKELGDTSSYIYRV